MIHSCANGTSAIAIAAAAEIIELIEGRRLGSGAEHVGSTAVPNLVGKNFVDLQITADPEDVPLIADDDAAGDELNAGLE
ncbi:MAG: GrpB family protein [Actinomycetota bacterium]